ncbi:MAG: hypothetical protein IT285_11020 [Bdellovibrionales bacterium]|nr:hypothetical protein [Bdellovibrionales bacterium]
MTGRRKVSLIIVAIFALLFSLELGLYSHWLSGKVAPEQKTATYINLALSGLVGVGCVLFPAFVLRPLIAKWVKARSKNEAEAQITTNKIVALSIPILLVVVLYLYVYVFMLDWFLVVQRIATWIDG